MNDSPNKAVVGIVGYGMGNVKSVQKAVEHLGYRTAMISSPRELSGVSALILPGVGAFGAAMQRLCAMGFVESLREWIARDMPFLGICLGLQLLFEESEEDPGVKGLAVLRGRLVRFAGDVKVPHIGWSRTFLRTNSRLFSGLGGSCYFYYVHSYYPASVSEEICVASCVHGVQFCSAVESGRIFATQFHPEKSGAAGLRVLANFLTTL